jgi:hypothetical protein
MVRADTRTSAARPLFMERPPLSVKFRTVLRLVRPSGSANRHKHCRTPQSPFGNDSARCPIGLSRASAPIAVLRYRRGGGTVLNFGGSAVSERQEIQPLVPQRSDDRASSSSNFRSEIVAACPARNRSGALAVSAPAQRAGAGSGMMRSCGFRSSFCSSLSRPHRARLRERVSRPIQPRR